MKRLILGVTGASGSILAKRAIEYLSGEAVELHLIATDYGQRVFAYETGVEWDAFLHSLSGGARVSAHDAGDMFACVASGSYPIDTMVVMPCSMSTAGKIASGAGDNLLCRAADVCIKEQRRLVLVVREAPLSGIHLANLYKLARCGTRIFPPVPAFYNKPQTWDEAIDAIVGRVLRCADVENGLYKPWIGGEGVLPPNAD